MEKSDEIKKISDHIFDIQGHIEELYRRNEARGIMSDAVIEQIDLIHRELTDIKGRLNFAEEKIEIIAEKAFTAVEALFPGRNHAECAANNALKRIVDEARKKPKA